MNRRSSEKTLDRVNSHKEISKSLRQRIELDAHVNRRPKHTPVSREYKKLPSIINKDFRTNSISFLERAKIKRKTIQFNNDPKALTILPGTVYDFNNNNNNINATKATLSVKNQDQRRETTPKLIPKKDVALKRLMSVNIKNLIPYDIKYSNDICVNANNNLLQSNGFSSNTISLNRKGGNQFQTIKVSLKKPKKSEPFLKKLLSLNTDNTKHLQILFKLKCIKWLWKCKSMIIEKLIFSYPHFKWFFNKYENIEKKRFTEFLVLLEVGKDEEFCEQLYLIYGQNKKNTMNIKECLFLFILTSNFAYDKKIILLIEVVDDDNNNKTENVLLSKLLKYFSITLPINDYHNCVIAIKKAVKSDEEVSKEELVSQLKTSQHLKSIFKDFYSFFLNIDTKMQEELNATFNVSLKYFMNFLGQNPIRSYTPSVYKQLKKIIYSTTLAKDRRDKLRSENSNNDELSSRTYSRII